eukprot:TRINITY_DN5967_c0_g1_i1.p2 TRINITY_DN5967_c0_g1~~TRINITY_DN5967_c0_g1_i1.p2  ORF type:complete len:315 (+),score=57.77 TRINITY_DN5967_c0_g1_i1:1659-2603(+)
MSLHVETPLLESLPLSKASQTNVFIKMDNVQPSGSFKIRGVGYLATKAVKERGAKRFIASSGGNAGLAVAYSARKLGVPATIVIPKSTPSFMQDKINLEGAEVIVHGDNWDAAHAKALEIQAEQGGELIHPFDHKDIWEGHSTIIHECHKQLKTKPAAIVTVVGGGGLLCGVLEGMHKVGWEDVPVVACETHGTDSFYQSATKGELITLPAITSIAHCLGARKVATAAFDWIKKHKIIPCLVTDREAINALIQFSTDHRCLVEPACAAGLAVVYYKLKEHLPSLTENDTVLVIVCGGNAVSMEHIKNWDQQVPH